MARGSVDAILFTGPLLLSVGGGGGPPGTRRAYSLAAAAAAGPGSFGILAATTNRSLVPGAARTPLRQWVFLVRFVMRFYRLPVTPSRPTKVYHKMCVLYTACFVRIVTRNTFRPDGYSRMEMDFIFSFYRNRYLSGSSRIKKKKKKNRIRFVAVLKTRAIKLTFSKHTRIIKCLTTPDLKKCPPPTSISIIHSIAIQFLFIDKIRLDVRHCIIMSYFTVVLFTYDNYCYDFIS